MSMDTAVPPAPSPVLHVLELLEAVLMQLDVRTLLVSAQRVNKRWYNVIGNADLQKKLFLAPDYDAMVSTENELLQEIFPFCFPEKPRGETLERSIAASNTRLYHYCLRMGGYGRHLSWTEWTTLRNKADAFSREDASWRRMLTHQPPLMAIRRNIFAPHAHPGREFYDYDYIDGTVHMSAIVQNAFAPKEAFGSMYTNQFPQGKKTNVCIFNTSWPDPEVKNWTLLTSGPQRQAYISHYIDPHPSDGPCPRFTGIAKILLPRKSLGERCSRFLESIVQSILRALFWLLGHL